MSRKTPIIAAVRGYAIPLTKNESHTTESRSTRPWKPKPIKRPSKHSLTFDCETTADDAQSLRFLTYERREHGSLVEKGIAYISDNPAVLTKRDIRTITEYAHMHGYALRTIPEFIQEIFYKYAYAREALVVGFNLPFDLSRLAISIAESSAWDMRNAFSLTLADGKYCHNVLAKHLNARSAFLRFAFPPRQSTGRSDRKKGVRQKHRTGFFQDVKTLAAALTGRSHALKTLADYLETEHRKSPTDEHGGAITPEYLDYAMNDTRVTWESYEKLSAMYGAHGLSETPPHRIYSEASLGKAYLREMGIVPLQKVQPDVPPEMFGRIMNTYYGGRAEAKIRRSILRVLYCDFRSMYPTVCTLMRLWKFVIAQGFDWIDWTEQTKAILATVSLSDVQKPDFWKDLHVIVQIHPDDDVLPVRAAYEGQSRNIGVNYLSSEVPFWYTLADCIAAKLLGNRPVRVIRAFKFVPREPQPGLQPIRIGGRDDLLIDPITDDFYRLIILLRGEEQSKEKAAGQTKTAEKHASHQMMLKLLANSTSYGIFAEQNVQSYALKRRVECYDTDGARFVVASGSIEEPGSHFHPLIATLITGAARLMLAITERLAAEEGIGWAFCDTDSMALARPSGMADAEFLERAERVIHWFDGLDPYGDGNPLFKMESENFQLVGGKPSKTHEPLYALVIAAKRYVLFNLDNEGRPIVRKALAHGLGHLWAPYKEGQSPANIPAPAQSLSELGVERWQYDLWYRIVLAFLKGTPESVELDDLPGLEMPAVSRYGVNTAKIWKWFEPLNSGRPPHQQVRCFNFILAYQVSRQVLGEALAAGAIDASFSDDGFPAVIAPFDNDHQRAVTRCFDRNTGKPVPSFILKTYREALEDYHEHAEAKFENGGQRDCGVTQRRHVQAVAVEYIGKEANRWEDRFHLGELPETHVEYGPAPAIKNCVIEFIGRSAEEFGTRPLARTAGVSPQSIYDLLEGRSQPRWTMLRKLIVAVRELTESSSGEIKKAA